MNKCGARARSLVLATQHAAVPLHTHTHTEVKELTNVL